MRTVSIQCNWSLTADWFRINLCSQQYKCSAEMQERLVKQTGVAYVPCEGDLQASLTVPELDTERALQLYMPHGEAT